MQYKTINRINTLLILEIENMTQIKLSILESWNNGNISELDRNDLIKLVLYFEHPEHSEIIYDVDGE